MNNNENLQKQLRLCKRESLETLQFNEQNNRRSLLELNILLIFMEEELRKMNPANIIDRTHDPLNLRYSYMLREDPTHTQHFIVVSIEGNNFLSCLTVQKVRTGHSTLEIIEEFPKNFFECFEK